MKNFLLWLAFFATTASRAQHNEHPCAATKAKIKMAKSASLTQAQIRKTERYDVHYYKLDLTMSNVATDVAGSVEMRARTREATDTIWYELFETLAISEIRLNGNTASFQRQGSAIKVAANLPAGALFAVSTTYSGTPPTEANNPLGGAGMTNDFSPSWGNQVTWSLSQPFSAYEWWPCKQSLRDKIDSLDVFITVPTTCKAGSNGVLEQVENLGNGTSRYHWKHRHPIDYYLVSVAVAEYIEYNVYAHPAGTSDSIRIQNFIYNNPATLANFQDDIEETADFAEFFSEIYGPYPFKNEKYGHCMAPIGGGMEHQTMTTQGSFSPGLTAHELAHQWFGDHVTCRSWADIWVNEGFASYSEYLMLARLYPGQEVTEMNDVHTNVMSQPGGSVWCADSLNGTRIFSSRLTYNKGSALIHTLRFAVNNDSAFFKGLRLYLTRFADSTALGTDVQAALEETAGTDLSHIFEQWYFGEGYPTYTARWNMVNGDLHIRITHSASRPTVTPLFTNALEVLFKRTGLPDTTVRFEINANAVIAIIPSFGNVTSIVVDPSNWIVNKTGLTTKDPTLNVTGMRELEPMAAFVVYPNPTSDRVFIESKISRPFVVSVINTVGREVLKMEGNSPLAVDMSSYAPGIYHFTVKAQDGSWVTHKLVRK